jgi:FxLD family lantipeptide
MTAQTLEQPVGTDLGALDLDVRVVESGDAVNVLLANTDDGCDTVKGSDC